MNEGIVGAPPLSEDDLADSRRSADWLKTHERKGLVEEGTLPHTGPPRFYSRNGFGAEDRTFQGDRFSITVPVDRDAYRRDPAAYERSGRWTVIPTVYPDDDGETRLHTRRDAETAYRRSGNHFGVYEGLENGELGSLWDHHVGNAAWLKENPKPRWSEEAARERLRRRKEEILEGRVEPTPAEERLYDMFRIRKAREEYLRREKAKMGPGGRRTASKGGSTMKRGRYPGSLNNPGNVEKRAERRRGEIASPHDRWAKFATPQDGLREMAGVMRQIADVKLAEKDLPFTIRNFAETYAPRFNEKGEPENDTDKYIRDISSTSGIDADTVLDRWNTDDMARLMKTVVRFESGVPHSEWFTDDEYRTAARELEEGATD